uniref:Uncharacterized protein n=1 Tax=Arundo donax TaxID=35708 RepID=A0A0A9G411_ARUDO
MVELAAAQALLHFVGLDASMGTMDESFCEFASLRFRFGFVLFMRGVVKAFLVNDSNQRLVS